MCHQSTCPLFYVSLLNICPFFIIDTDFFVRFSNFCCKGGLELSIPSIPCVPCSEIIKKIGVRREMSTDFAVNLLYLEIVKEMCFQYISYKARGVAHVEFGQQTFTIPVCRLRAHA